jgi:tetratricopeptide (TPR) repeat protein
MAFRPERVLGPAVLAGGAAALAAAGLFFGRGFVLPFPQPSEMKVRPDGAVEDVALMSLGMRRAAADLAFVRLLQYYGTQEGESSAEAMAESVGLEQRHHEHEGGVYPEFYSRAREIVDLDPYFEHGVLFAVGSLAFNQNRPEEAIDLLNRARARDPHKWRYDALLAAIGYKKAGDPQKVADSLLPVALDPDSPAVVKQVTAFLLKRIGRRTEAVNVYRILLDTTQDQGYIENARRNIAELSGH